MKHLAVGSLIIVSQVVSPAFTWARPRAAFNCQGLFNHLRSNESAFGNGARADVRFQPTQYISEAGTFDSLSGAQESSNSDSGRLPRFWLDVAAPLKLLAHAKSLKPTEVEFVSVYSDMGLVIIDNRLYKVASVFSAMGPQKYKFLALDESNVTEEIGYPFRPRNMEALGSGITAPLAFTYRPKYKGYRFEINVAERDQLMARVASGMPLDISAKDFASAQNFIRENFKGGIDRMTPTMLFVGMPMFIVGLAIVFSDKDKKKEEGPTPASGAAPVPPEVEKTR